MERQGASERNGTPIDDDDGEDNIAELIAAGDPEVMDLHMSAEDLQKRDQTSLKPTPVGASAPDKSEKTKG
jgi:hypothetical protein